MGYGVDDYKKAKVICKNKNNFGKACYEFCPYRENGCCELSKNNLIDYSLQELLGVKLDSSSSNFSWDLLELASKFKPIRKAIVSGSYDPFTCGHLELVKQASQMFDEVHVVIFVNSAKKRTYNVDDMCKAIDKTLKEEGIYNCIVNHDEGLLAEYCKKHNITTTIRGLRNNLDYNYEENIVEVNKLLNKDLQTIYLRGNDNKISSSTVRELMRYGKDVSMYVPKPIFEMIKGV